MTLTMPTIHLNGTPGKMLADAYSAVYDALETAAEKLRETAPNGRDYYPQGPDGITAATREHDARMRAIRDLQAELTALVMYCEKWAK